MTYKIKDFGFDPSGIFTIWNGISDHPLDIYDSRFVSTPRYGKHYLTIPEGQATPLFRLEPASSSLGVTLGNERIESPDSGILGYTKTASGATFQYPHYLADAIIVSRYYAQMAYEMEGWGWMDPFYVDRLVVVEPLYSSHASGNGKPRRIGAACLRKYRAPLQPETYMNFICCNRSSYYPPEPSLLGIAECLKRCERTRVVSLTDTVSKLSGYFEAMKEQRLSWSKGTSGTIPDPYGPGMPHSYEKLKQTGLCDMPEKRALFSLLYQR